MKLDLNDSPYAVAIFQIIFVVLETPFDLLL